MTTDKPINVKSFIHYNATRVSHYQFGLVDEDQWVGNGSYNHKNSKIIAGFYIDTKNGDNIANNRGYIFYWGFENNTSDEYPDYNGYRGLPGETAKAEITIWGNGNGKDTTIDGYSSWYDSSYNSIYGIDVEPDGTLILWQMDDWGFDFGTLNTKKILGIRTPEYDAQSSSPFGLGPNKKAVAFKVIHGTRPLATISVIITLRLNNIPQKNILLLPEEFLILLLILTPLDIVTADSNVWYNGKSPQIINNIVEFMANDIKEGPWDKYWLSNTLIKTGIICKITIF